MDVSDSLLFYYSVCLCNVVLPKITIVGLYTVFLGILRLDNILETEFKRSVTYQRGEKSMGGGEVFVK